MCKTGDFIHIFIISYISNEIKATFWLKNKIVSVNDNTSTWLKVKANLTSITFFEASPICEIQAKIYKK